MKKTIILIISSILVFGISMGLTMLFSTNIEKMSNMQQDNITQMQINQTEIEEQIQETIIYENKLIAKELLVGWKTINPNITLNLEDVTINILKEETEEELLPEKDLQQKPELKPELQPELEPDLELELEPDQGPELAPEPDPEVDPDPEPDPDPDPEPEPEPKPDPKPEPEIQKPNIINEKTSEPADGTTVKYGDIITYTITVSNTGTKEKEVVITDNIPKNTEFIEVLDEGEQITEEEMVKAVKWNKLVLPNEEIKLRFKVKVIGDVTNTIKNVAIVDNTPTNETVHTIVKNIDVTSIKYTGKNIILVLDLSSSMLDATANGQIRLEVLKKSAKSFIDTTLQNENNTISLITFNYDTKENAIDSVMNMKNGGQWAVNIINSLNPNIVGTKIQFKSSQNANELKTFIDSIELKKPLLTNIQEAMNKTLQEVNRLYNIDSKKENVVLFIGDGAPSCTSYTNGNEGDNGTGYGTNENYGFTTQEKTENLITNYTNQIKKKAEIYAIGYELAGEDEWKQEISNNIIRSMSNGEGYYYNATASNLSQKFEQISISISEEKKETLTCDELEGNVEINLIENTELQISNKTLVTLKLGEEVIEFDTIEKINNYFETTGILQFNNSKFIINTTKIPKENYISLTYYYK